MSDRRRSTTASPVSGAQALAARGSPCASAASGSSRQSSQAKGAVWREVRMETPDSGMAADRQQQVVFAPREDIAPGIAHLQRAAAHQRVAAQASGAGLEAE